MQQQYSQKHTAIFKPIWMKALFCFCLIATTLTMQAQQKIISLYDGAAPGSENWNWYEKENDKNLFGTKVVYNVSQPTLTAFLPDSAIATGTAIIICPGGAFHTLSINREGTDVAAWLVKKGIACFVLKYRLVYCKTDDPVGELMGKMGKKEFDEDNARLIPLAIADGRKAIEYVKNNASIFGIHPGKIGILGFSAGGTIAASTAFNFTPVNKPDFVAATYPFFPPEMHGAVDKSTPPLFIATATDDILGLAPHSVALYKKWLDNKLPAELHLYSKGGHGFGMEKQNLPSDKWIERFYEWMQVSGWVK
jgi:acetyl esterase/lipase